MSDSKSDCYSVLGLAKGASAQDARAAYRRLAKRFHPDAPDGDQERFYVITQAHTEFEEIAAKADPRTRQKLVSGFWKLAKAAPEKPQKKPINGANLEAVLYLSLEDALMGAQRRVTLPNGRALDVQCPAGCASDDIIRLKGAGGIGRHGGMGGDALIRIKLLSHKRASLRGRDLHMPLWLDLVQLRSGGKVEVVTPHGPLKVSIPALSSHGQSLRLKGKGLPGREGDKDGHLYFTLKSRRATGFTDALHRFNRVWGNPLRPHAQSKA
jgi:DnaJ-class molecular chaperone